MAVSNIRPEDLAVIEKLARAPLHRFADFRNAHVPRGAIGLYSVWKGDQFVYIGRAGKASEEVQGLTQTSKGLRGRLDSHASGRRSGDKFCVYVADRFVLSTLTTEQIEAIAAGTQFLDSLVGHFIHEHLSAYKVAPK